MAAVTADQEIVYAPLAEISKWEDGPDGSLYVYGRATTPEVDTDQQIVSGEWSGKALQSWLETAPALRVQHNGQRDPAGSGVRVEVNRDGDGAHWVKGVVDEPVAQRLVRKGHLRAFSVGIQAPVIERDMTGKAKGGIINGGRIVEVSLVDSPANRSCFLEMAKADKRGNAEWTGALTASDDILAKADEPEVTKVAKPQKTVTVELPANMSLSVKPSDLAKLATFKQRLTAEKTAAPEVTKAAEPEVVKAAEPDDPEMAAVKAAEAEVYKRDIDTATRRRLAGEGRALSNLSYPVETHEDADNAVTLILSGHGNVGAARKLVSRIARKEGWQDILDRLKGKKKDKIAAPDAVKCMKCDGSGMVEDKPCPDCKKGKKAAKKAAAAEKRKVRKALAAPAAVKKKKVKVMCPNCGAKQNVKHVHCTECGRELPRAAPQVVKNHDFACLHCGTDLDKGEKFCAKCGTENPGYLPEADHKIPANKAAGEERVTKRKKAKGNPFGDKKAPPFGSNSGEDGAGDDEKTPKKAEKRKGKGKGKGRSPAAGVAGHDGNTMPLPAHREPDSPAVEEFENDSHLQDGDHELKAAMRHKALAEKGISRDEALLHDLTCPAFDVAAVTQAFPYATFDAIDAGMWQAKALESAASAPLEQAGEILALWQHATTLKMADPQTLHDLRIEAHKAFRDANPGPGSFPTPGHVTPQQFQRPYLAAGHGAESPQAKPARTFGVPEGQPSAEQYTRPYLTEGRAADSPDNDTPRHEPQPASMEPGKPERVYYRGTMKDNARQAMTAMHDHISRVFPDVCPMSPELGGTQKPAPQVPVGVGGNAPVSRKAAKAKARKQRKALAARRRRLERKVLAGKMTVKQARAKLGLKPAVTKARKAKAKAVLPAAPVVTPIDPEVIKAAVLEATAPLLRRQARQEKVIRKQRKAIDAIASQPDTSQAPLRGAAVNKGAATQTSAPPAGMLTTAGSAEQAQAAQVALLFNEWRNNPDPGQREAAYGALTNQLGLNPVNTVQTPTRFMKT